MLNFIEEVKWRGMLHDDIPGTEEHLLSDVRVGYVGIDPTADSLHVGHLVSVMMLKHFQLSGHKPLVLIGGATGMIGDPSGKSKERNLLDDETLARNQESLQKQLEKFLDFDSDKTNSALMVNNYVWMKDFSFLSFIRDIGKHISVNYMMSKDSVKSRISSESAEGMSFTEFTYQLVQGYDFLHLYKNNSCTVQMGGSDQWGNIITGSELIRRKDSGKAFAVTCPLITKADGTKFGKTESGNIWLDPNRTSPYEFYQFWLNVRDEDAIKYIKIFTLRTREEIENLIATHQEAPHLFLLQKTLAEDITIMVHSEADLQNAINASKILFGKSTNEDLEALSEKDFLSIFDGVPTITMSMGDFETLGIIDALSGKSGFLSSNSVARREITANSISVNKNKIDSSFVLSKEHLIKGKYLLLSKGKRNNYIVIVE